MTIDGILRRSLTLGGLFAAALLVVSGVLGLLLAGLPGLWAALIAVALSAVFLGLTAASILLANRVARPGDVGVFFGVVLGGWLLKFVLFLIVAISLKGADWVHPIVFGVTMIVAVVGSLAIDLVVMLRARTPIDVALPTLSADDTPESALSAEKDAQERE